MATAKTGAQLFAIFSLSPSLSFVGGMSYIGFTSDTWWPVDGDQYQPHAHMVGNRLLSAKVNYLVHLHWCAGGEYIHTYAQTVGCRMHIFTIIERVRFKVKWACRVSGRYSVGQGWRADGFQARVCASRCLPRMELHLRGGHAQSYQPSGRIPFAGVLKNLIDEV